MNYFLFKLNFTTPVHFGAAQNGSALDKIIPFCRADTFFSAMCNELVKYGEQGMLDFIDKVRKGKILFSNLLPYYDDKNDSCLYLPKPIINLVGVNKQGSLKEIQQETILRKKQKKNGFIRASRLTEYLVAVKNRSNMSEELPEFGSIGMLQKVNCRENETLPYLVGVYSFASDEINKIQAGLYIVVGLENIEDLPLIEQLIVSLGLVGIGGKRSSGYGKFELNEDYVEMDEVGVYEDDAALFQMLVETQSNWYMNISTMIPARNELESVKAGTYKLIHRSGFIWDENMQQGRKRDGVFALEAGSCFQKKIDSEIVEIKDASCPHAIYRYGKAMFMGLNL